MTKPKRRPKTTPRPRPLTDEAGSDDGLDPRDDRKREARATRGPGPKLRRDRKALQLGRQVAETLDAVLAGDSRDDLLGGLRVVSVTPAPDASHLLVTLAPLPPYDDFDPAATLDRIALASGRLRVEVASAITRKRAPLLTYRLTLPGES